MLSRLTVRDGQKPEQARREFDGMLGVRDWPVNGPVRPSDGLRDQSAPWWWESDEEASQGFLAAMGVNL